MHITVLKKGQNPVIERCTRCCSKHHCPFCGPEVYCPNELYHVQNHVHNHIRLAVDHDRFIIVKCNLKCRDQAHFHCCYCTTTVIRKVQIIKHLTTCRRRSARLPLPESTTSAPVTEQHSVTEPPSVGKTPSITDSASVIDVSAAEPVSITAPASVQISSTTEAPSITEKPSAAKRVHVQTKVQCSHCGLTINNKNLKIHMRRRHSLKRQHITDTQPLSSRCIDPLLCIIEYKVMPGPPCADWYYVGVDVGSGSVRAALVTRDGHVKATAEESITVWTPQPDHYEQSSADIWSKCCNTVKKVTEGVRKDCVRGIGFDATCSLVILDQNFQPVSVNKDGVAERNVVMWMDHRALEQASRITATKHRVLCSVGGVMSPEMQPPKLLWLKENLRESCWKEAAHFFDLPDFLSWKATGSLTRSLCTLVCKWTYSPPDGWDDSFWTAVGLEDLLENSHSRIGEQTCGPGSPVGEGLTRAAAADLGLNPGTAVGASLIDAHAGGLGVIGADVSGHHLPCENQPITSRMALICGTSSCHMAVSQKPLFVPGVWGPYLSAMVPGLWLNEGGQSATGGLIDHVVKGHAAFPQLKEKAEKSGEHVYNFLNHYLEAMGKDQMHLDQLTAGLHVWPDFHGNRSPLADQTLKGMVVGLSLSQTLDDLALLYLATVQAIALGTRHILDAMREAGHDISTLFLCGGLSKNLLFVQMHANVTGLPVVLPAEKEAVLVGAAVLGACAFSDYSSIQEAMEKMAKIGKVIQPNAELQSFYRKKYAVFLQLCAHQREYSAMMCD